MSQSEWAQVMGHEDKKLNRLDNMRAAMQKRHAASKVRRDEFATFRARSKAGSSLGSSIDLKTAVERLQMDPSLATSGGALNKGVIKRAFFVLARVQHPDKICHPTEADQDRFAATLEAYDFLNALTDEAPVH
jgi:hypothetical protein